MRLHQFTVQNKPIKSGVRETGVNYNNCKYQKGNHVMVSPRMLCTTNNYVCLERQMCLKLLLCLYCQNLWLKYVGQSQLREKVLCIFFAVRQANFVSICHLLFKISKLPGEMSRPKEPASKDFFQKSHSRKDERKN